MSNLFSYPAAKAYRDNNDYRKFRRQLFHTSLSQILEPIRDAMTNPIRVKCSDGNYRRAVLGLGPYIADYPEQCLLACVVQWWCPKYVYWSFTRLYHFSVFLGA